MESGDVDYAKRENREEGRVSRVKIEIESARRLLGEWCCW